VVFTLRKTHLLRSGLEFEQVYKQGKRRSGPGFSLIFSPNKLGFSRLGISVHRQIRGAVKRNRIKRIIRESFRLNREIYPQGADIVFAVRPAMELDSPAQITGAVDVACGQAR
jgi:ribonuclease P protein component